VVEFQRRSGDVVAFSNFYRATIAALGPVVERPYATPALSLPAVTSPGATAARAALATMTPQPTSQGPTQAGPGQVVIDESTQQCLMDMASSKDSDVQRESVRFLASASAYPVNQQKLSEGGKDKVPQLVDIVGKLLSSKDKEVVRCSTMLLANLAQSPTVRLPLVPLVPQLLQLLDLVVPSASVNALLFKEVRRQIARTLVSLSSSCKKEILKDGNARLAVHSVLDKQRATNDEALRPLIDAAMINFGFMARA